MRGKSTLLIFLMLMGILLGYPGNLALGQLSSTTPPNQKKKKLVVDMPKSAEQARNLFNEAYYLTREEKFDEAVARYKVLDRYFFEREGKQQYLIAVLNNLAMIQVRQGRYAAARENLEKAQKYAVELQDWEALADFYFKLGLIYSHMDKEEKALKKMAGIISATPMRFPPPKLYTGSYTLVDRAFGRQSIQIKPLANPFAITAKDFSKLFTIKVRDEFDPYKMITPDRIECVLKVNKSGYYPLYFPFDLPTDVSLYELDKQLITKERVIKAVITEDFYNHEVTPEEITLSRKVNGNIEKPVAITGKQSFKPGRYLLAIRKAGYVPIFEDFVLFPSEEPFVLRRTLSSKVRQFKYFIEGDYIDSQVIPDEITLNNQPVTEETQVKPGTYMLVIRKEGYDPLVEKLTIKPDERPYELRRAMRTLEREVVFKFTSDYEKGLVDADEVTFTGKLLRNGDTIKPGSYHVAITKKGYNTQVLAIKIAPGSEPFILSANLLSAPRRVDHNIRSKYPRGKVLPEKLTLNGKDALTAESFKPGKYTLYIQKDGYLPVNKQINIPPDITTFTIEEVLEPKKREVITEIVPDIAPEDSNVTHTLMLTKEGSDKSFKLQSGMRVEPQQYSMMLTMPGYESQADTLKIVPASEPYFIFRRMIAKPREVIANITGEFPVDVPIYPDDITLDSKQIIKGFKIVPGSHNLAITKKGYYAIRKDVFIGASDKPYIINAKMVTMKRLVTFEIYDAQERAKKLSPDEAFLNKERFDTGSQQLLKPGIYKFSIRLRGYKPLQEQITIPVGTSEYQIIRYLEPTLRPIKYTIISDFDNKPIEPDLFTLGDTKVKQGILFKPGDYPLVIQKAGYNPLLTEVNIGPSKEPFEIRRTLISKPRKLIFKIRSDFPPQQAKPDKVILGPNTVNEGDMIKPGVYTFVIEKKGYYRKADKIVIEPSEEPYVLEQLIKCMPRLVTYDIKGDFDPNMSFDPESITLNGKDVDGETTFLPGKYTLKIEHPGYNTKQYPVVINPSDKPYHIEEMLESIPREIEFDITGDFPPGEPLEPEVIAFNNNEYEDEPIKPGHYELLLQAPGFEPYRQKVVIEPDPEPYYLKVVMISKLRVVKQRITFDVKPSEELGYGYQITLAPKDDPSNIMEIKDGCKIKPNFYTLSIKKEAYEDLTKTLRVWPDERPCIIEERLTAKLVTVLLNITHDVSPPPGLEGYKVTIIDINTGIPRFITHNKKIKPGIYRLRIDQPGYKFGSEKELEIEPSLHPFEIRERLIAKERTLNFRMVDPITGELVKAHDIFINGQRPASFKKGYPPGIDLDLVAKFKRYQTEKVRVKVVPGEGPLTVPITLKRLKRVEFDLRRDSEELDDITYEYEFYADDTRIEDHLISKEKAMNRFYYTCWVPENAKNIKVYAGYLYTQCLIEAIYRLRRPNLISGVKLKEHLEQVTRLDPQRRRKALEVIEFLLKNRRKRMRQLAADEIDLLVRYVDTWKFDLPEDNIRKNEVLQQLERLRK